MVSVVGSSSYKPSCWSLGHQFRSLSPGVALLSELFCQILSWHLCSYWLQSNLKHVGISLPEVQRWGERDRWRKRVGRRKIGGERATVKTRLQIRTKRGVSLGTWDCEFKACILFLCNKYMMVGFITAHVM